MNIPNKKSDTLKALLLAYFLFGAFLCFFNNHFPESKQKAETHHESVLTFSSPAITANYEIKIPQVPSCSSPELARIETGSEAPALYVNNPKENFSHIKILLKLNNYNLFFASGFHEPPLAA